MAKNIITTLKHFIKKTRHPLPLCQAPFNNLLIDQEGNFKICCHNSTYILGNYPTNSVSEIWFGEKRKAIIQDFLDQKTPESCKHCIEKGLNLNSPDSKIRSSKIDKRLSFNNYPHQIEFLLSNNCNLDCIMCSPNISSSSTIKSNSPTSSIFYDETFLNQIKLFLKHGNFFVFSGGEPFLIPIYEKIWDYIHKNNQKSIIYIQTNASVLNEQIKNKINKYKMEIGVSIDSVKKETYEKIRRNASFEKTFENLDYFIQHTRSFNKTLTLIATPMTINASEIPEIVSFCNSKEIYFSLSILEWPKRLAIWSLSSSELNQILEKYQNFKNLIDKKNPILLKNHQSFRYFKELVEEYAHQKRYFEKNQSTIENNILDISQKIASNFHSDMEKAIEKMNFTNELKKKALEKSELLINKYFELFSPKFSHPNFFYAFFIKTPKSVFIEHILNFDDSILEKILEEKMNELVYLLQTKSYNRIIDFESYE